eukprot:6192863-Pleurochrysis_carterae.AAC.1
MEGEERGYDKELKRLRASRRALEGRSGPDHSVEELLAMESEVQDKCTWLEGQLRAAVPVVVTQLTKLVHASDFASAWEQWAQMKPSGALAKESARGGRGSDDGADADADAEAEAEAEAEADVETDAADGETRDADAADGETPDAGAGAGADADADADAGVEPVAEVAESAA